ncbi:MAG: FIST C-terminal domain-containing protein [Coriobacteriales bacterium]|nr:FIST C-terminal domain-containing protein [Coriobacteriales bacterium]
MKANIGESILADAARAGAAAAKVAAEGLSDIKLAFVYSSVDYNQQELLQGIAEELPGVPLIGNTSFNGIITPRGFIASEDGFVGVMAISNCAANNLGINNATGALDNEDADIAKPKLSSIGVAGLAKLNGDARATGRQVALDALAAAGKCTSGKIDAPDYFYMVAPPGEEEFYLKGITDIIGRVPFFGGSAADNTISGQWLLFTNNLICADGVAVAFFYSDAPFANYFTGAYEQSSNVGVITKVRDNRVLVEIDGVPAVKKYAEWTGQDPKSLLGGNLLVATITAPLGVKDRLGDLVAIRHPMNGNDDYSMNIGANLAENTAVIQMQGSIEQLLASAKDGVTAAKAKLPVAASALHLVHCGGRLAGIGDRREELAANIIAAAGDTPFITEFTFGEYGYEDDGNNSTGGLMLSFSAFA